ncbi:MAG: glycosyltransferase family 39 protein [Bacteroidota bacterium]
MRDKALWIALTAALVIRLAAVPAVHAIQYTSDEREYLFMAGQLLDRGMFQDSNGDRAVRAPLYPIVLSALLWLAGRTTILAHVAGVLLGAAICWLTFHLAGVLGSGRREALAGAWIAALSPGLVIYSALLQTETLYIVWFLLTLLFLYRLLHMPRPVAAAGLGVFSGLAALTRPVFLGFLPVVAIYVLYYNRGRLREGVLVTFVALAVTAAVIAPWTLRNAAVLHAFVPVSSGGGSSLVTGNNPHARGTFDAGPGFAEWFADQARARGVGDPATLNETDRSALGAQVALSFIGDHPGSALALAAKKSFIFWIYPVTHSDSYLPVQAIAVGADALLLAAAVIGIAGNIRRNRLVGPLVAALIVFWLVQAVMHAEARFRLPLVPILAVFGGWGVGIVADREARRRLLSQPTFRRIALTGLVCVALIYLVTGIMFLTGSIG